jgi:micrococcal nuclease
MKKKALLLLIIALVTITLSIALTKTTPIPKKLNNYGNVVVSKVVSVYDGDTFRVNIKNHPPIIGHNIPIRLNGIDCPEIRNKKVDVKQLAVEAKELTERSLKTAKKIELKNMKRGKYFRIIANVEVDGVDLGDLLVKKGLAKVYDGGSKPAWP